ncbi:unnamed protein product, partial [Adineta steineri]
MWRPTPSLLTETLGILMLVFIWLYPVWRFCRFTNPLALIFIPIIHMLAYVVCQRLLFRPGEVLKNEDLLYSWNYYRWWFLERLWSINYYWLQHILGTQFYNAYLQLCGANIGRHAHIYTALIEAPWLLEVGQSTFIDDGVMLSNLSYHDQTFKLHSIRIGSFCSLDMRSVLYHGVDIERGVTVFGRAVLAPFEITDKGNCCCEEICLGSGTNLGNECTLMPGTRLAPNTMVGNLTRITRKTSCINADTVLLGIPASRMPFV